MNDNDNDDSGIDHDNADPRVVIDVSSRQVAAELAYAIIGRAQDIHDNPHDDFEDVAVELRDIGHELLDEYEDAVDRGRYDDADEVTE